MYTKINMDPLISEEIDAVTSPMIIKARLKKMTNMINALDKKSLVGITTALTSLYKDVLNEMGFGDQTKDLKTLADIMSFSARLSIWSLVDSTVQSLLSQSQGS